jgi:hypothetical protein
MSHESVHPPSRAAARRAMRRRARWAALTLLFVAACRIDGELPSGTRCDDGVCGPGFVCSADVCVRAGSADAGPDPDVGCGKTRLVADAFAPPRLSSLWFTSESEGGSIQLVADSLQLVLPGGREQGPTAAIFTEFFYDLRESDVSVAVPVVGDAAHETTARLEVGTSDFANAARIAHRGGQLYATVRGPDGETTSAIAYIPAEHLYWRLAERSGRLLFQTGATGDGPWVTFSDVPAPAWLDLAYVSLGHESGSPPADTLVARFADLNGGQPRGRLCPVADLSDTFDDGSDGPLWFASGSNPWCMLAEAGGEVVMTPNVGPMNPMEGNPGCGYRTRKQYGLDGSSITATVNEMIGAGIDGYADILLLGDIEGFEVGFFVDDGTLLCQLGGEAVCQIPFVLDQHRHVRMSLADGMLRWETSGDGATFQNAAARPSPFADPSVVMSFRLQLANLPMAAAGVYRLASVNAPN